MNLSARLFCAALRLEFHWKTKVRLFGSMAETVGHKTTRTVFNWTKILMGVRTMGLWGFYLVYDQRPTELCITDTLHRLCKTKSSDAIAQAPCVDCAQKSPDWSYRIHSSQSSLSFPALRHWSVKSELESALTAVRI